MDSGTDSDSAGEINSEAEHLDTPKSERSTRAYSSVESVSKSNEAEEPGPAKTESAIALRGDYLAGFVKSAKKSKANTATRKTGRAQTPKISDFNDASTSDSHVPCETRAARSSNAAHSDSSDEAPEIPPSAPETRPSSLDVRHLRYALQSRHEHVEGSSSPVDTELERQQHEARERQLEVQRREIAGRQLELQRRQLELQRREIAERQLELQRREIAERQLELQRREMERQLELEKREIAERQIREQKQKALRKVTKYVEEVMVENGLDWKEHNLIRHADELSNRAQMLADDATNIPMYTHQPTLASSGHCTNPTVMRLHNRPNAHNFQAAASPLGDRISRHIESSITSLANSPMTYCQEHDNKIITGNRNHRSLRNKIGKLASSAQAYPRDMSKDATLDAETKIKQEEEMLKTIHEAHRRHALQSALQRDVL
ncbi:hypothetical protein CYMTET_50047 [Cymbomonas tetramitiformis]|uniref:Uncharacterized protein n=1 Tax=Cymbomonas tetramitiformis TaxID=36881 RepID=A0AAE0ETJ0_9CHLO|nr:hypothetical protein CYMTET_50047 [Cymbomonas tetramitiformis]